MVTKKTNSEGKKTKTIKTATKKTKTQIKKTTTKKEKIEDRYVVAELAFYCCDNNVYFNLSQLCDGLNKMSNDTFSFHVNNEKNDFYNWIKYVYGEEKLAEKILKAKTKKEMLKILKKII
jgi:hypothetical protein